MSGMKLKAMMALLVLVGFLGTGAGWVWYQGAGAAPPREEAAQAPGRNPGPAQEEQVRQELGQLKQDLQKVLQRMEALETRLAARPQEQQEVLFQGKPASFWIKALKDRDEQYRQQAVKALGAIGEEDRTMIPFLIAALSDRSGLVSGQASAELAGMGKEVVPSLLRALKDAKNSTRIQILYTLSQMGPDASAAVPALTELLKRSESSDRIAATVVLAKIGPEARPAVPALLETLKDKKKPECHLAVRALGRIGPDAKAAVPALVEMLKEKNPMTFPVEINAFVPEVFQGGSEEVTPAVEAASTLGQIGPNAKEAIPALLEAHQSAKDTPGPSGFNLKWAAFNAIQKIDPKAVPKP